MAKYMVSMPITGHVTIEVEAEDGDSAVDAFWVRIEEIEDPFDTDSPDVLDLILDFVEHVAGGNVTNAELNDVEVHES